MSDIEVVLTCPLGSTCEEVKNGKIYRCRWYKTIKGTDAQGEEHDERDCAIAWMPIIGLETALASKGTTQATESFRNEMVKSNETTSDLLAATQLGLDK